MANKQHTPSVHLGGAELREKVNTAKVMTDVKNTFVDDSSLSLWKTAVDVGRDYVKARYKLEQKTLKIKAAATLGIYQQQLANASSINEFDELNQNTAALFEKDVKEESGGDDFWCECGAEMLGAYQQDAAQLREDKEREFGRNCLDNLLADTENIFAGASIPDADVLLRQSVQEIDETPFLNDTERKDYREHYLKTAVLNMALSDPEQAKKAQAEFLPDDEDLKFKIDETEKLSLAMREKTLQHQQQEKSLASFNEACLLWQKKEQGVLNEAQYYVLSGGKESVFDTAQNIPGPLVSAYRFVKKLNNKEDFDAEDLKAATLHLASAYKEGKLGLEETSALQNQLLLSARDKAKARLLFDKTPDILADKILAEDTESTSFDAEIFMEQKAKTAFEIYDTYYTQKTTRADEFLKNGGVMTAGVLKKISREALTDVNEMFGFAEAEENISFEELEQMTSAISSNEKKKSIWQKFAEEAPYISHKKELMAKLVKNAAKISAVV